MQRRPLASEHAASGMPLTARPSCRRSLCTINLRIINLRIILMLLSDGRWPMSVATEVATPLTARPSCRRSPEVLISELLISELIN